LIEAQQKTSPVVQKADDAKKNATTGNLDELIANILEIRNYIRDHPCPPVPAAAALGKLNEIPAKNLPEATRKILSQVISILTKHSSATTETLKEIRTQLDSLRETINEQPAKLAEVVREILPGITEKFSELRTKIEEGFDRLSRQISTSTTDIRSNIAGLPAPTDYTKRFDDIDAAIKAIKPCPEPNDYGPQFTHIDESVRTLYAAVQVIAGEDYGRRFDELNRKMDDLMALMRKCCGEGQLALPAPAPAPAPSAHRARSTLFRTPPLADKYRASPARQTMDYPARCPKRAQTETRAARSRAPETAPTAKRRRATGARRQFASFAKQSSS